MGSGLGKLTCIVLCACAVAMSTAVMLSLMVTQCRLVAPGIRFGRRRRLGYINPGGLQEWATGHFSRRRRMNS